MVGCRPRSKSRNVGITASLMSDSRKAPEPVPVKYTAFLGAFRRQPRSFPWPGPRVAIAREATDADVCRGSVETGRVAASLAVKDVTMTALARWRTRRRRIATTTVAGLLAVTAAGVAQVATGSAAHAASPSVASPSVASPLAVSPSVVSPTVTGPITGGKGVPVVGATAFDLGKVGYRQSEYFLAGSATAYQASGTLGSDGKWTATPAATASYTTRIVVNRPIDAKKFNGTVVAEWFNVSAGYDGAPDWTAAHNQLIRDGYAWVGVSAQAVGLNATKNADPDPTRRCPTPVTATRTTSSPRPARRCGSRPARSSAG